MSHFKPCKYLDYDEKKYPSCDLRDLGPECPLIRFWFRRGQDQNINVQFCKLKGRINSVLDCYEPGCLDYKPKEGA